MLKRGKFNTWSVCKFIDPSTVLENWQVADRIEHGDMWYAPRTMGGRHMRCVDILAVRNYEEPPSKLGYPKISGIKL
jgi:hypothetical protein